MAKQEESNKGLHPVQAVWGAESDMPESCRRVARFIADNPLNVASMTIDELARASNSSKSAVVRLCKLSGYSGYRDLRHALLENRGVLRGSALLGFDVPENTTATSSPLGVAREVIRINLEVLQETLLLVEDEPFSEAVSAILNAKQVIFVGFGSSAPVAQDAYQRFLRLSVPAVVCSDPHVLASMVANVGPDSVLFCITYSGTSRDIVDALESATERGCSTITLTSAPYSPCAKLSSIILVSAVRKKPFSAETVASRIAQLAVIDVLCAIIALKKEPELEETTRRINEELDKKRIGSKQKGRGVKKSQ